MNNIFISLKDIEADLKQIEETGAQLALKLDLLTQNIAYIFSEIKFCDDVETVDEYFEILDKIQSTLAVLAYKENVGISDRLRRFTSDFDNFDGVKNYYLTKIKTGEYVF